MDRKIAVIMITYNGERFFRQQADSILNQSLSPQLFYIQDDCSKASFQRELLALKEQSGDKIELNLLGANLGVIGNVKSAIASQKETSLIALSDQDDIWKEDKLLTIVKRIEQEQKDMNRPVLVYHDAEVIDENGNKILPSFWQYLGQNWYQHRLETFLFGNFITGSTTVFNQALATYAKTIPEDLKTLHDAWLGLCAFCFGEVIQIKEPLNLYRHHGNNVAFKKLSTEKNSATKKLVEWLSDKNFLEEESQMIERFVNIYETELSKEKLSILTKFLRLTKRPPFFKRIVKYRILRKYRL